MIKALNHFTFQELLKAASPVRMNLPHPGCGFEQGNDDAGGDKHPAS